MDIYPNHTKRRLAEGRIAIGMGLHQSRTTDIAAIAKTCGYDWLFIDMEHSALDIGTASQIAYRTVIEACRRHGKSPGMGGVIDHTLMQKYIGMGMRFILSGNDTGFLMAGARIRSDFLNGLEV